MANPTVQVQSHSTDYDDPYVYWPLDPTTSTTYQTGELIGRNSSGYATHFDDSASLSFLGIFQGIHYKLDTADTGLQNLARIKRAYRMTIPLATGTVGRADATNGAIGKLVYVQYSGACLIDPSSLTYGNVLGRIVDIGDLSTPTALTSTRSVVIETVTEKRSGGVRWLSATGNQSLSVTDIGKTIFIPNSANLTVSLPGVANCPVNGEITFLKTTAAANPITLDPLASETIDGSTTVATMDARYDTITIINSGSEWFIKCQKIA